MFLIAEIILTIVAWNRGWRWKSLLPLIIGFVGAFVLGFLIGTIIAASGGSIEPVMRAVPSLSIFFNVGVITALIVMCIKKPAVKSEVKKVE